MTLNKQQLACLLAECLNVLNEAQASLSDAGDTQTQGRIHDVVAKVPRCILEAVDFANNGTVTPEDVLMTLKQA